MSNHKNFCILPFIHLATNTNGTARLCCKSSTHLPIVDASGKPYTVDKHSLDEIFNSEYMNTVRKRILDDEKLDECAVCFREEDMYYDNQENKYPSKRRRENQKWLRKTDTKLSDTFEELTANPRIRYLDIRMGNLCNLKCRMCWPQFSSQIERENAQFAEQGLTTWHKQVDFGTVWDNAEQFWTSIDQGLVDIEEITFVGGEPTLHDGMYDIIYAMVDRDLAKNVRLKITTNLTNLQPRLLASLKHFRTVIVDCSIDGVEEVQEYIRYPSSWRTINKNVDRLLKRNTPNTLINISSVVQLYNIFDLHNLISWYLDKLIDGTRLRNIQLMLNQLYEPEYLSVELLTASARERLFHEVFLPCNSMLNNVINNIESYDEDCQWRWRELEETRKRIVGIAKRLHLAYLKKDTGKEIHAPKLPYEKDIYNNELATQCLEYTKQLDKHRSQSVHSIIPNFEEIINDSTQ